MKLLIITSILEFEADIKQLLKKSQVLHYSYQQVTGHRGNATENLESNWFASNALETESILFYAFVNKENVHRVFEQVEIFNQQQQSDSHVHVVSLAIEKSN
jgi:nitrogen regulatory protein PII